MPAGAFPRAGVRLALAIGVETCRLSENPRSARDPLSRPN